MSSISLGEINFIKIKTLNHIFRAAVDAQNDLEVETKIIINLKKSKCLDEFEKWWNLNENVKIINISSYEQGNGKGYAMIIKYEEEIL